MGEKGDKIESLKKILLGILGDDEVRDALRETYCYIQKDAASCQPLADDVPRDDYHQVQQQADAWKVDAETARKESATRAQRILILERKKKQLEDEIEKMRPKYEAYGNLEKRLSEAQVHLRYWQDKESAWQQEKHRINEAWQKQCNQLQQDKEASEHEATVLEQEKRESVKAMENAQHTAMQLEQAKRELTQKYEQVVEEKHRAEQESNAWQEKYKAVFHSGRQAYDLYLHHLGSFSDNVHGQFRQIDTFEAFICNAAQVKNLKSIWQMTHRAIMSSDTEAAQSLREILKVCFDLVNLSRKEDDRYVWLGTQVGDRQDMATQSVAGDLAQGCVREVLLQGYRNPYTNEIVKSIVTLG